MKKLLISFRGLRSRGFLLFKAFKRFATLSGSLKPILLFTLALRKRGFGEAVINRQSGIIHTLPLLIVIAAVGVISFLLISSTIPLTGLFGTLNPKPDSQAAVSNCGLTNPIFCDTFDVPRGTGNRSGDLNGDIWGVSRITSNTNFGGGIANNWVASQQVQCNGSTKSVLPERDVTICNGMFVESVNDGGDPGTNEGNGGQTILAAYPKQPFDIAGRTGRVTFDVGADAHTNHTAWPAFVYTDQPIPVPYEHAAAISTFARNSFGFSINRQGTSTCQTVDTMFVTRNYELQPVSFSRTGCVTRYSQIGQLNHFELRISQSHVEVWGTDPGSTTLKQLAVADNVNLPLTRGLIWLEDIHYNACKYFETQCDHTFFWDNVGFDGPYTYNDWATDVMDRVTNGTTSEELGWTIPAGGSTGKLPLVAPISAARISKSTAAHLTLSFGPRGAATLSYSVNGNPFHTQPWPFSGDGSNWEWRTLAMPVPLSELVGGNNTVEIKSSVATAVANIDIILVAGGDTPCNINPSQPCNGTPIPLPTPAPTPASTPTPIPGGNITVDFNSKATGTLTGQYPTGIINWGANWIVSGPFGQFNTNSISFSAVTVTQSTFSILTANKLNSLQAFNGGTTASTVTLSCSGNPTITQSVAAGQLSTITTGWANSCSTVTITSSNSWGTNFDNLVLSPAAGATPAPTPVATPTPSSSTCPKANLGDLDCDGDIDIFDYSTLVANFGKTGTNLLGDLDKDGDVDIFDYSTLVGNFGK